MIYKRYEKQTGTIWDAEVLKLLVQGYHVILPSLRSSALRTLGASARDFGLDSDLIAAKSIKLSNGCTIKLTSAKMVIKSFKYPRETVPTLREIRDRLMLEVRDPRIDLQEGDVLSGPYACGAWHNEGEVD
jgi:hypothetical protein